MKRPYEPEPAKDTEPFYYSKYDKYLLFKKIYPEESKIEEEDEMFTKNSSRLIVEQCKYSQYISSLEVKEAELEAKKDEKEFKSFISARSKFFNLFSNELETNEASILCSCLRKYLPALMSLDGAKLLNMVEKNYVYEKVSNIYGYDSDEAVKILCQFGLVDFIPQKKIKMTRNEKKNSIITKLFNSSTSNSTITTNLNTLLEENGKEKLTSFDIESTLKEIIKKVGYNSSHSEGLIKFLKLQNKVPAKILIPLDVLPSAMTGIVQISAQKIGINHIYGYPFEISTHFPVTFCHPVFGDFLNIIRHWNSEKFAITQEVKEFFTEKSKKNLELIESIDKCVLGLIQAFLLSDGTVGNEAQFVKTVVEALKPLFPIRIQFSCREGDFDSRMKIDAGIFIENFPFVLFEAKHMSYSINAVLQGQQYYGLLEHRFIDNDPCFLVTFDHGIMFIYGIATVNCRTVCDCLLTLEFTNYRFNINGFLDILHHTISAFYFFHQKFTNRMSDKEFEKNDPMHLKYFKIKFQKTPGNIPWPVIFDLKSWTDETKRISFSFEKIKLEIENKDGILKSQVKANFKANVYLVKLDDESDVSSEDEDEKMPVEVEEVQNGGKFAVLKICYNYDIESHDILAKLNMAPKIYGYEKLWENFHVILMEYLDFDYKNKKYKCLFDYLQEREKKMKLPLEPVFNSLTLFLAKIHENKIVHGDFRSNNILIKTSFNSDGKEEFEFKLIDFEFTGKVGSIYPCLSVKNIKIEWPKGFDSFCPRAVAHDQFMLKEMEK